MNQSEPSWDDAPTNKSTHVKSYGYSNMADIELYQEDSLDDGSSGEMSLDDLESPELNLEDDSQECDQCNPDDDLSAIQKLERYLNSENVYSRQMVARNLLETIRSGEPNAENATKVLEAMAQLAEDQDPMVRTELMEQVPHIAMFCHENASLFHEDKPISSYILPIIIKYLTYTNNQVRKTSQAALLVLLEQGLLEKGDVEKHVCPVIIELACAESPDDFRTEAVALMSKMAPLVGDDMTCRIFLPRFADMCTDTLFHVRKVCAANFGDLCSVVGQDSTEALLLPKFCFLCEDGVWGVRKACAECFTQVACACSTDVRRKELAQTFLSLICDQSRWVRMAAFQALGGFISTFADPSMTGLYFNEEGLLVVGKAHDCRSSDEDECDPPVYSDCDSCEDTPDPSPPMSHTAPDTKDEPGQVTADMDVSGEAEDVAGDTNINNAGGDVSVEESRAQNYKGLSEGEKSQDSGETAAVASHGSEAAEMTQDRDNLPSSDGDAKEMCTATEKEPTEEFNSFLYWRTPLPEVDITVASTDDTSAVTESTTAPGECHEETATKTQSEETIGECSNEMDRELSENVASLEIGTSSSDTTEVKDATEPTGVVVHTASLITTEEEPTETVAHFGTTHVLGEHVGELAMKVVDGVVQDFSDTNMTYSLVEDKLCARRDSSSREDDMSDEFRPDQDVIPQVLLDQYLSMTDPARAQTVDSEIAKHCAYSLPAVAYTLGRKYWPCLRELYETLAADMQWKVRRTLAFSIHELGMILGEEITTADLVPIFNGFLRDLDEVRVGVLKHLADFLKLLKPELRREYLTRLTDFLNTDNNRNWRFREDLAEQLGLLVDLFSADDVSLYMLPIVFTLAYDKVAQVRLKAFSAMSVVMSHLAADEDKELLQGYIADLIDKFASNKRWTHRQAFQHICYCVLDDGSLSRDKVTEELLPAMLKMASDPIVNVRITLGKTLAHHVITSDYFMSADNPHLGDLLNAVQALRSDGDRDVCCFMHWAPESDHLGHPGHPGLLDTIPV